MNKDEIEGLAEELRECGEHPDEPERDAARAIWQAMLAAFQQENSDGR